MAEEATGHDLTLVIGYPSLELPLIGEPTTEELARRKRMVARARQLRKENGSIGIASDDLLHESRQEHEKQE